MSKLERIAKRMAGAGLCSRREAESWILEGRVRVNGTILTSPAVTVTEADDILVDGVPLPAPNQVRLWLYHKPRGILTTSKDPQNRPTVFESLPKSLPRVISVGRLDMNSEGLLLLTTSGALAKYLTDPRSQFKRIYKVRCKGTLDPALPKILEKGLTIDGFTYAPLTLSIDRQQGHNSWVTMTLTEGKNREIRKILEHFGHPVSRLIRTQYGPFQLEDLKPWAVKEIPFSEFKFLLEKGETVSP